MMLLPRLDRVSVDRCLALPEGPGKAVEAGLRPEALPDGVHYAASGGSPAPAEQLLELRSGLSALARDAGYPDRGTLQTRARFDARAGALLREHSLLQSAEALRDDVWAFISTVLVPDICAWRFPDRPAERFHGGVRNTFQRLWMRAVALDRGVNHAGRWGLLDALSEDALVQITERPSIGADPRVARAFAEAWVRASGRLGRGQMEDVTRAAVIRVRLRLRIQFLSVLEEEELTEFMDSAFRDSEHVLREEESASRGQGQNDGETGSSARGWWKFKRRRDRP